MIKSFFKQNSFIFDDLLGVGVVCENPILNDRLHAWYNPGVGEIDIYEMENGDFLAISFVTKEPYDPNIKSIYLGVVKKFIKRVI